jgi:chemosensory pili system protein ChpA (sensor histidine kinase/response regulator)
MQPEQQQRIMGYFIEESKEHLNTIEQGLLNLQSTIADPEAVNEVFRAAHSIKGGAAMLGLSSIQNTAHRLEDYFKVLKETRGVFADPKLETLLKKVFEALQTLLAPLSTPTGLTDDLANPVMAEIEPVFAETEQHLDRLVQQITVIPDQKTPEQSDSALMLIFQNEVPAQLREMLQLFRQAATQPQVRTELQEICLGLHGLGAAFALESWSDLLDVAQRAVANPASDLQALAPIVIKEIKQAQELVLAGQSQKIAPSEQLLAMAPAESVAEPSADFDADLAEFFAIADGAPATDELDFSAFESEPALEPIAASEADRLDLDALFDLPEIEEAATEETLFSATHQGPEMGMAELNSLADLFEGGMPELGSTWQQEEVIDPATIAQSENARDASIGDLDLDLNADETSDFSDLLFATDSPNPTETSNLDSLFGDSLLEEPSAPDADLEALMDDLALPEVESASSADLTPDLFLTDLSDDLSEPTQNLDLQDFQMDALDSASDISQTSDLFTPGFEEPAIADFEEEEANDSLNHLGELFAGLDDMDLQFSQPAETPSATAADFAALNGQADAEESDHLLSMLDSIDELETPQAQASIELSDMDDLLSEFADEPIQGSPATDLGLESAFGDDASTNLDAELDDLFAETPAAPEEIAIEDLLILENEVPAVADLSNDDFTLDLGLETPELAIGDDLLGEQDLGLDAIDELASEPGTTDEDLDALFDESPADHALDLFADESLTAETSTTDEELDALLNEAPADNALDLFADESLSQAETDLADLFSDETALDLTLEPTEIPDSSSTETIAELSDFLDLKSPEVEAIPSPNLEEISADADDLLGLDFAALEDLSSNESAASDLNLDDLDFDAIAATEAPASNLDHDLDALNFEMPEATTDSAADLQDLGLDFALPEESLDVSVDSLVFSEVGDTNDDVNLDLLGLDAQAEDPNLGETPSFDDLDLNFDDLAPAPDEANDLTDLDSLLDPEQGSPEDSQDDNLDLLLGAGIAAASVTGLGAAIAANQSNGGAPVEDSFGDLDDLDQWLAAPAPDAIENLAELDGLLNPPLTEAEPDQFADLESLLATPSESPAPSSGIVAASPASDTEFGDLEKMLEDTEQTMGGSPTVKNRGTVAPGRRSTRPSKGFSEQTMRVPVKHLDNLSNLVGELVVNRNSLEQDQERMRQSLDNLLYQVQQLSDVGQRMQDLYERSLLESSLLASRQNHRVPFGATESNGNGHATGVEYDPLEMDRFTGFHSLSQEMIELIVRVRESASDIEFIVDETDQVTRMFRQVTTQLQEGLTRSRMVPFAQAANRLPRAVRDIALKCGKQAELVIDGGETLIDKMILEHLYDPLTHLVNNAITHGIEDPSSRQAGGKAPMGHIMIRVFHQGNQTIISVGDDGAGVDVERVRKKALEKGLITPAEAQTMSRLDIYDLLFHPGFSTKDEADDFAGRGVGMDVVRTSLSEIRGTVSTDSIQNKGTTFTIRLPLTLSISKALCCISDRARIAFPMDGVEDMLDIPKERIQLNAEGQPCVAWRDSVLPLRPLKDLLSYNRHLSRGNVYGGSQDDDMVSIVILRSAGNYLALQVDQVLGEQEIVIKQLESPVPKPIGIAGATVLGDGRIMPIADVLELIDLSMGRIRREIGAMWDQGMAQTAVDTITTKTEPTVLIVDDSITVRELLSMTFNKVGYRVEQARDGQEAWEKLRSGLPCDIVFCDIEMPRMDGLELLSRIQKDPNLNHLPIAMLTSRGADRHRQMASSLGASGYFTKPYLEEALLDAAQRMLKGEVLISNHG